MVSMVVSAVFMMTGRRVGMCVVMFVLALRVGLLYQYPNCVELCSIVNVRIIGVIRLE